MWPLKRKQWENLGITIKSPEAREILSTIAPTHIFLEDRHYRALCTKDFNRIKFDCWFPRDYKKYREDIWDCDNFAIQFMAKMQARWAKISKGKEALCFGYIKAYIGGKNPHAFIWMITDQKKLVYYEPQTGSRIAPKFESVCLVES